MMIHHAPPPHPHKSPPSLPTPCGSKPVERDRRRRRTRLLAFDSPLDFFAEFELKEEEEGLFLVSKPPE